MEVGEEEQSGTPLSSFSPASLNPIYLRPHFLSPPTTVADPSMLCAKVGRPEVGEEMGKGMELKFGVRRFRTIVLLMAVLLLLLDNGGAGRHAAHGSHGSCSWAPIGYVLAPYWTRSPVISLRAGIILPILPLNKLTSGRLSGLPGVPWLGSRVDIDRAQSSEGCDCEGHQPLRMGGPCGTESS